MSSSYAGPVVDGPLKGAWLVHPASWYQVPVVKGAPTLRQSHNPPPLDITMVDYRYYPGMKVWSCVPRDVKEQGTPALRDTKMPWWRRRWRG